MGQNSAPLWDAGGHDCVREGDRGGQLDQGDVVTANGKGVHPNLASHNIQNMVYSLIFGGMLFMLFTWTHEAILGCVCSCYRLSMVL